MVAKPSAVTPPTSPDRDNPATFSDLADAYIAWLTATGFPYIGDAMDYAAQQIEQLGASAPDWVSGASYTDGDVARSLSDRLVYKAITTHSGETTDPASDTTNWTRLIPGLAANNDFTGNNTLRDRIGEIAAFPTPSKNGWIKAYGQNVSRATYSLLLDVFAPEVSGTLTSGAATVTGMADTTDYAPGMAVEGTGIQAGTTISSVDSATQITLSENATASDTQTDIRVFFHGAGDGSTTFGIPDLRGRAIFGKDDMGGSAASRLTSGGSGVDGGTLGATGGAETHTLTEAELASHNHSLNYANSAGTGSVRNSVFSSGASSTTTATGGDSPHNNMPPAFVSNIFIYTGVYS